MPWRLVQQGSRTLQPLDAFLDGATICFCGRTSHLLDAGLHSCAPGLAAVVRPQPNPARGKGRLRDGCQLLERQLLQERRLYMELVGHLFRNEK